MLNDQMRGITTSVRTSRRTKPTSPICQKKIFVPVVKLAFIFSFTPQQTLEPIIPGGRGRLSKIFFSRVDYLVEKQHQLGAGETGLG